MPEIKDPITYFYGFGSLTQIKPCVRWPGIALAFRSTCNLPAQIKLP
jgi:hypothetical protein